MRKTLKKYLIPHKENDYKPHLFREASLTVILGALVILFASSFGATYIVEKTSLLGNVSSAVLTDLTNQTRKSNNESTLSVNPILQNAATLKANDMAAKSYFAHTSPEGITPWYWFAKAGYLFSYAGENLAVNFTESTDVNNAWLASPHHRENILDPHFTEIGIATSVGQYQGRETTFVVQLFGKPKAPKKTPVPTRSASISPPLASAITTQIPAVQGASVEDTTPVQETSPITENTESVVVKSADESTDTSAPEVAPTTEAPEHYSTFVQRLFVNQPHLVQFAYKILMAIIAIGLILFIFIEMRVQHPRQVMYGILLLVLIVGLFYINQSLILTNSILI